MRRKQQSPIWPYLGILACLFVLSLTAPRAWDRMTRRQQWGQYEPARATKTMRERTIEVAPLEAPTESELAPRPELVDRAPAEEPKASPEPARQPTAASEIELPIAPTPEEALPHDFNPSQPFNSSQPVASHAVPEQSPASEVTPSPLPEQTVADTHAETAPLGQAVTPAEEFAAEVREEEKSTARPSTKTQAAAPEDEPTDASNDEPPAEPDYEPAVASAAWPLPRVLLEQLAQLASEDPTSVWAEQAVALVHQLCQSNQQESRSPSELIKELRGLAGRTAAVGATDPSLEVRIARARYALARWLDVWDSAAGLETAGVDDTVLTADKGGMHDCLLALQQLTRKGAAGAAWREYLCLDELGQLADSPAGDVAQRRAVARKVLDRLGATRLNSAQQKFATQDAIQQLQSQLRLWAAENVTPSRLLADVERYEHSGLTSDAHLVADDFRGLHWSNVPEATALGERLDTHYRNANIRLAVSGSLLNRLLPQPETMQAPVNDTVVNVPVHGHSTTLTKLSVRLIPDPRRIRLGIEANGEVHSDTVSTSGPATLYNKGAATFLVRKLILIGPQGMSVWPAIAEAESSHNNLTALETDFDWVPIVGSLVRGAAMSQAEGLRDEARMEVEQKVAVRAGRQLDAEIRPRLVEAAENIQKKQAATLKRLGLELAPLDLSTTEDRVVARVRLATTEQLGAHTPRPRAPSDSWFSLQLHESALNNGLEQLDLNGRSFDLRGMFAWIAEKLDRPQLNNLDELPDDVRLTFAPQDAVRLRCENDRIEVTFAFAELTQGRHRWKNFSVKTFYRPEAQGMDPRFVRDGTISLDGKSVRGKAQPVLRLIFSKVLSKNRDLSLLDEKFTADPRIKDLKITQFTVEGGWIGLAYSPRRTPSNMARRPK